MSDLAYFNSKGQLTFGTHHDIQLSFGATTALGTGGDITASGGTLASGSAGGCTTTTNGTVTFVDSTANAFTASMVGLVLTISASSVVGNETTALIVGYTSASTITLQGGTLVTDTAAGDTWSIVSGDPLLVSITNATAAMVGGTVTLSGNATAANNGTFLVTAFASATKLSIRNPLGVTTTATGTTATFAPMPTVVAGDIGGTFVIPRRAGVGHYYLVTTDGFPQAVTTSAAIQGSTIGTWHVEMGTPVQCVGGQDPFLAGVSTALNAWAIPFSTVSTTTVTEMVPGSAVTGTHGVLTTPNSLGVATLTDSTAGAFLPAHVGMPIVFSTNFPAADVGTWTIVGFLNINEVLVYIPGGVSISTSTPHWSITPPAIVHIRTAFENGPVQ